MKKSISRSAMPAMSCAVMCAVMWLGVAHAQTVSSAGEPAKPAAVAKTKKAVVKGKTARSKAKFMPGSEETPAQRSARLKRECLGAVNAGVCAGYTR